MSKKKKVSRKWTPARRFAFEEKKRREKLIAMGKDVASVILRQRAVTKNACPHLRTNSDGSFQDNLNIKWMRHSNDIIMGICGTCLSPFDTRNPQDLQWFLKDSRGQKWMAKAVATQKEIDALAAPSTDTIPGRPLTNWQKFAAWVKKIFS